MVLTVATVSALTEYRTEGFNNKNQEDVIGVSVTTYNVCFCSSNFCFKNKTRRFSKRV